MIAQLCLAVFALVLLTPSDPVAHQFALVCAVAMAVHHGCLLMQSATWVQSVYYSNRFPAIQFLSVQPLLMLAVGLLYRGYVWTPMALGLTWFAVCLLRAPNHIRSAESNA